MNSKSMMSLVDGISSNVEGYVRRIVALEESLHRNDVDRNDNQHELARLRQENCDVREENYRLLDEVKELRKSLDQSQSEVYQARENLTRCMSYDDSSRVVAGFLSSCEMYLMPDNSYMISRIGLIKATKMCLGMGLKESKEFTDNNLNTRDARKYCNM